MKILQIFSLKKISINLFFTICVSAAYAQVNVLTQHNDISRTGANLNETILNTSNVNVNQFGKLFTRKVDDQIYAQLLIVSNLTIPGKGMHNVVFCATVNNSVYAFDADNAADTIPLWHVNLNGNGVPPKNTDMTGACGGNYKDFSGNIGIVGTPVIDIHTNTIYLVARTKENGSDYIQRIHALDITTGQEKPNSPTIIKAGYPGTGQFSDSVFFNPQKANQRAGLLLLNGVVYICWASHCDWGPYHGWIMGYDATTLQQVCVYNDTPNGTAGGIWMSGQAPAADTSGNIYVTTGNGTVGTVINPWDEINRGQSFLKLTPNGGGLTVSSWFTPHNFIDLEVRDWDLGSAGVLLIPGTNLITSGGKEGRLYLLDRDNMGGYDYTTDQTIQDFPITEVGNNLHGAPPYWDGPGGPFIYTWTENDSLRAFKFDNLNGKFILPAYGTSTMAAPQGMPGGMLSISANGSVNGSGIIWATHPLSGDANQDTRPGILRAFDAANIANELWNTEQNPTRDGFGNFAKFNCTTIANGKAYLATFSNQLVVYGLLNTTGLKNSIDNKYHMNVYPNPASNQLGIAISTQQNKTSELKLTLTDVLGQVMIEKTIMLNKGLCTTDLSTVNLPNGTYVLTMNAADFVATKKVVIQH